MTGIRETAQATQATQATLHAVASLGLHHIVLIGSYSVSYRGPCILHALCVQFLVTLTVTAVHLYLGWSLAVCFGRSLCSDAYQGQEVDPVGEDAHTVWAP